MCNTMGKRLIVIAVLMTFLVIVPGTKAETLELWGMQIKGWAPGANAQWKGNEITLIKPAVIVRIEGNARDYCIQDINTGRQFCGGVHKNLRGLLLPPGTYRVFPGLKEDQSSASVSLYLSYKGSAPAPPPGFKNARKLTLVPCAFARHKCYGRGGNLTFRQGRLEVDSLGRVRVVLKRVKGKTAMETHPPYRLQVFYLGTTPSVAVGDPFYTDNQGNFDGVVGRIPAPGDGPFVVNSSGIDGNCRTFNTGARQQFITNPFKFKQRSTSSMPVMGPMEWDTDRMGLDYSNFDLPEADPALCRDACARDSKCKAWTYVKPNTIQGPRPRCWLKYAVPRPSHNTCCVSGVKH